MSDNSGIAMTKAERDQLVKLARLRAKQAEREAEARHRPTAPPPTRLTRKSDGEWAGRRHPAEPGHGALQWVWDHAAVSVMTALPLPPAYPKGFPKAPMGMTVPWRDACPVSQTPIAARPSVFQPSSAQKR